MEIHLRLEILLTLVELNLLASVGQPKVADAKCEDLLP
jgi:hypothetical protein